MLYIGADHGGFDLKEKLKELLKSVDIEFVDVGAFELNLNDDFTDFTEKVINGVMGDLENNMGVIICRTGTGSAILANKHDGIMAVEATTVLMAEKARSNNNANVLALGGDIIDSGIAWDILRTFINTPFSGKARYVRRIDEIKDLEKNN